MGREHVELIAGRLGASPDALPGRLEDPDDGSDLGPQRATAAGDLERALACAWDAWSDGGWSGLPVEERALAVEALAAEIDERVDAIAVLDATDSGVPLAVTSVIAGSLGDTLRGVAARARTRPDRAPLDAGGRRVEVLRLPWGPALLLTPFNAPAGVAVGKIANALMAGCPAILKPSEHAPGSAGEIARAAVAAGLPAGALQVVHGAGDTAGRLVSDDRVRMISLTGGAVAGRAVARAAAPRMAALQLELGGSNPALVCADADFAAAAAALAAGATKLNGQWCEAPRRVLVDPERHDDLVDALREALDRVEVGTTPTPGIDMGPQAHSGQRDGVLRALGALAGTQIPTAAVPDGAGLFLRPVLVTGLPPERVTQEIFGPVLTVHAVAGDAAMVAAANANGDGLAAYVFSGDRDRAFRLGRRLHAGEVRLGGTNLLDLAPGSTQSFWGSSGVGAHGDAEVLESFRGSRVVGEEDPGLPI